MLFVLVGAAVDIRYTASAGASALLMIGIALLFRAAGVFLCMAGTQLNKKEQLFCVIAYLPKSNRVQAAIGSVPLSLGLPCGQLGALGCSACDSRDRADWSDRDGQNVSEAVGA